MVCGNSSIAWPAFQQEMGFYLNPKLKRWTSRTILLCHNSHTLALAVNELFIAGGTNGLIGSPLKAVQNRAEPDIGHVMHNAHQLVDRHVRSILGTIARPSGRYR